MYDAQLGRWHGIDPHAKNYYSVSPYSYANNNPIVNVDPDGKDWHSFDYEYRDAVGGIKSQKMYRFTAELMSQKQLDEAGIKGTYLGRTYYDAENETYYSLLGDAVLLSQYEDKDEILEMFQDIDEAIENYYWSAYMNEKQKDMSFPEYYSAGTDMGVSRKVSNRDVLLNKQVRTFPYKGGKVSYEISNLPSNASIDWGDGVMKPATGFTISTDRAVNVLIRELNRNFVSVLWQFPNVQSWNNARRIAETLLKDRIW